MHPTAMPTKSNMPNFFFVTFAIISLCGVSADRCHPGIEVIGGETVSEVQKVHVELHSIVLARRCHATIEICAHIRQVVAQLCLTSSDN